MHQYQCPYCLGQLNVKGFIVFSATIENSDRGVLLLSDQLGDYTMYLSDNLKVAKGQKIHLHCPNCQHSLEYSENANLARVMKLNERGEQTTVVFSAIMGEQSTYHITEERTMTFGEHALRYMDPDWYKKING